VGGCEPHSHVSGGIFIVLVACFALHSGRLVSKSLDLRAHVHSSFLRLFIINCIYSALCNYSSRIHSLCRVPGKTTSHNCTRAHTDAMHVIVVCRDR